MGVRVTAPAVYRGPDGSIHYLSSTATASLLIITDPAYGAGKAVKIVLDGPCRQVSRGPNLPAGYRGVEYESISATGSTLITVSPGRPPFEHTIVGGCSSCMQGEHDFGLWPVCPSGDWHRKRGSGPVDEPERVDEPGTSAAPSAPPGVPAKRRARVRRLGAKKPAPEPAPESGLEPVRGMAPVPTAVGPTTTNLADIDGPSWGPRSGW